MASKHARTIRNASLGGPTTPRTTRYKRYSQIGDSLARIYRVKQDKDGNGIIHQIYASDEQQVAFNFPPQIATDFQLVSTGNPSIKSFQLEEGHTIPTIGKDEIEVQERDIVLIGSDGIFDNLSDGDIEIILNAFLKFGNGENDTTIEEMMVKMIVGYRKNMDKSMFEIIDFFMKRQNFDEANIKKTTDLFKGKYKHDLEDKNRSLIYEDESIKFNSDYAKQMFREFFPPEQRAGIFDSFLARKFNPKKDEIDKFFNNFNMHKIAQSISNIAYQLTLQKNLISGFTLKAFNFGKIHPQLITTKSDDISVSVAAMIEENIDLKEIRSIMFDLELDFHKMLMSLSLEVFFLQKTTFKKKELPQESIKLVYQIDDDIFYGLQFDKNSNITEGFCHKNGNSFEEITREEEVKLKLFGESDDSSILSQSLFMYQELKVPQDFNVDVNEQSIPGINNSLVRQKSVIKLSVLSKSKENFDELKNLNISDDKIEEVDSKSSVLVIKQKKEIVKDDKNDDLNKKLDDLDSKIPENNLDKVVLQNQPDKDLSSLKLSHYVVKKSAPGVKDLQKQDIKKELVKTGSSKDLSKSGDKENKGPTNRVSRSLKGEKENKEKLEKYIGFNSLKELIKI